MSEYRQYNDDVFTVSDVLSAEECAAYIAFAEGVGFVEAPISTGYGDFVVSDVRNNRRAMVDDLDRAADLWRRVKDYVPTKIGLWHAIGLNERLRFYRYESGQRFRWHRDGAFRRENGERSRLTFMIYLNDDFVGGRTSFTYCTVEPVRGTALLFTHEVHHQGDPVREGVKYVLRTDVMYRPE
ncbi:MAG: 2OG-Fe(II) oxygenase [Phycisphaera sp.]|nr:2OG-Fe(II) oxygenase [Phycisphaera sp.]